MGTNCHHLQETVVKLIIDKFAIIHVKKKKNKASLKENPNSSLIMSPVANKKRWKFRVRKYKR